MIMKLVCKSTYIKNHAVTNTKIKIKLSMYRLMISVMLLLHVRREQRGDSRRYLVKALLVFCLLECPQICFKYLYIYILWPRLFV